MSPRKAGKPIFCKQQRHLGAVVVDEDDLHATLGAIDAAMPSRRGCACYPGSG